MKIRLSTFIYLVRLMPYNIKNCSDDFNLKLDVDSSELLKKTYNQKSDRLKAEAISEVFDNIINNEIEEKILEQWQKI